MELGGVSHAVALDQIGGGTAGALLQGLHLLAHGRAALAGGVLLEDAGEWDEGTAAVD